MPFTAPSFLSDLPLVINWWAVLFLVGAAAYPITRRLFSGWWDQGYLLSKAVGLLSASWIVWQLGSYKLLPFSLPTIIFALVALFGFGIALSFSYKTERKLRWGRMIVLECLFLVCLVFWSFIKGHEAEIRSLEKFMDYGFSAAIQQSPYFPPPDMWYAGGTVNYYYFGHLTQALLSTLSGIDLSYGYNFMLATLFAFCFTMSFSIGVQMYLYYTSVKNTAMYAVKRWKQLSIAVLCGFLTAFLVTLAGNMQTLYAFTKGYSGEDPPAIWTVLWPLDELPAKLPEGINRYWYANATRFIPFTIHEFPGYSFVVSDNHGHVFNIPFVLLMIAGLFTFFVFNKKQTAVLFSFQHVIPYILFGGLIGVLLMTNALDGPVYLGLFALFVLAARSFHTFLKREWIIEKALQFAAAGAGFMFSILPFVVNFKSFASGLAVNCPPGFLAGRTFGPLIFETVDKCQKSPLWMMWLLWGFFWFAGLTLLLKSLAVKKQHDNKKKDETSDAGVLLFDVGLRISHLKKTAVQFFYKGIHLDSMLLIVFAYSVFLIFFSEFFYFKDIYPAHFRSNTMFKFGYQAFILCSILAGHVIVRMLFEKKHNIRQKINRYAFLLLLLPQLFLLSIFPVFAVRSYFGNLEQYRGLYGLSWFQRDFPDDYNAMLWLKQYTAVQPKPPATNWLSLLSRTDSHVKDTVFTSHIRTIPVLLEADGDSYTEYNRMSAFIGLPTIIGWGVHEWLWRGTYDVVAPRKEEVRELYETGSFERMKQLIQKYNIQYVIVGTLERKKFTALAEGRFDPFGRKVYQSGSTAIYRIDK